MVLLLLFLSFLTFEGLFGRSSFLLVVFSSDVFFEKVFGGYAFLHGLFNWILSMFTALCFLFFGNYTSGFGIFKSIFSERLIPCNFLVLL